MENSCDVSEMSLEEEMQQLYIVNRQLGQGAFGKVFECKNLQDGLDYAIKVIEKNSVKKSKIDSLREEAKIMSSISHPNVVKLYSMHETELRFYLRMELIQHGTLGTR
jgi:serine/threonine protein kinase